MVSESTAPIIGVVGLVIVAIAMAYGFGHRHGVGSGHMQGAEAARRACLIGKPDNLPAGRWSIVFDTDATAVRWVSMERTMGPRHDCAGSACTRTDDGTDYAGALGWPVAPTPATDRSEPEDPTP